MKNPRQYRWTAPDGRVGRWRKSPQGAMISAVSTYLTETGTGVKVTVDARIAEIFWPDAHGKGWRIKFRRGAPT